MIVTDYFIKLKYLAITICFYLNVLTVLPTVKALNIAIEKKCHATCCGKKAANNSSNGCQKENCFLNINFNNSTFLVFDTTYQLHKAILGPLAKVNIYGEHTLISSYNELIWQPPE